MVATAGRRSLMKFLVIGSSLFIVNYVLFLFLYTLLVSQYHYSVPFVLSYLTGILLSHLVYRKTVFRSGTYLQTLARYFIATIGQSVLSFIAFSIFLAVNPEFALLYQLCFSVVLALVSFVVSKLWTFR